MSKHHRSHIIGLAGALAVSSLLMSGCVLGNKKVVLDHGPNYQLAPAPSASDKPIVFEDFSDKRTDQRIGERKNIYFMTMSKVYATNDVAKWVNDSVENELKKYGYSVSRGTGSVPGSGVPVLSGDILDVNSISYMAYTGIIKLKAILTRGQQSIGETTIETNTKPGMNLAASTKGHIEALNYALQEAVGKIVDFVQSKVK